LLAAALNSRPLVDVFGSEEKLFSFTRLGPRFDGEFIWSDYSDFSSRRPMLGIIYAQSPFPETVYATFSR